MSDSNINYYWVRIYDYKKDEQLKEYTDAFLYENHKGTLLDEYYLSGEDMTRDMAKQKIIEKSGINRFAKPRKTDGVYCILMESNEYFYDRFTKEIDSICFCCHKEIKGKAYAFPCMVTDSGEKYYFCSNSCKWEILDKINPRLEGEFQSREDYTVNGGVYGYIYHIYNRATNKHYIGQTVYMPFFRWQEHVKSGLKGDICDLVFETITEVRVKSREYLNNIEAWWINKYIDEYGRDNVVNLTVPHITLEELATEYSKIVTGQLKMDVTG